MKQQIRLGVFETNSSSIHSITITEKETYEAWKKNEVLYCEDKNEFLEADKAIEKNLEILINDYGLDSEYEEESVLEQADKQTDMEEHAEAEEDHRGDNIRDSVEQNHEPAPVIPMTPDAFTYPEYPAVATQEHGSDAGRWTVGLNASGGLLAANSVRAGRVYYSQENKYGYSNYSQKDMDGYAYYWGAIEKSNDPYSSSYVSFYQLTEHISKHRLPVRFGLSLQYQLNPHVALLPLHPILRVNFNTTAAWECARSM
jgi:hypothetical protein